MLALLVGLLVLIGASAAQAQTARRVIVLDQGSDALSRRIRAEATNAGFEVLSAAPDLAAIGDAEALARHDAVALVRVVSSERVELTIGGARGQRSVLERNAGEGPAFALRAVEELRARLLEQEQSAGPGAAQPGPEISPSATPNETPSSAAVIAPPPPPALADHAPASGASPTRRLWIRGGAAVIAPVGGVGPSGHALLGVAGEPFDEQWGISALALLPLTENEVSGVEGEAELGVNLFMAELDHFAPLSSDGKSFLSLGAGGGLLVLALRAEPSPGFEARKDSLIAGVYYLHVGAGRRISPWLRLRLALEAGVSAPRPVIRFDAHDVAAWGRTFAGASVAADLGVAPIEQGSR